MDTRSKESFRPSVKLGNEGVELVVPAGNYSSLKEEGDLDAEEEQRSVQGQRKRREEKRREEKRIEEKRREEKRREDKRREEKRREDNRTQEVNRSVEKW